MPQMESILTAEGKVRLYIQLEDFHGRHLHATWDDLKFGLKHYSDFERIAMVGDRRWEKWMTTVCKPFTKAKVMYFDKSKSMPLGNGYGGRRKRKRSGHQMAVGTPGMSEPQPLVWTLK